MADDVAAQIDARASATPASPTTTRRRATLFALPAGAPARPCHRRRLGAVADAGATPAPSATSRTAPNDVAGRPSARRRAARSIVWPARRRSAAGAGRTRTGTTRWVASTLEGWLSGHRRTRRSSVVDRAGPAARWVARDDGDRERARRSPRRQPRRPQLAEIRSVACTRISAPAITSAWGRGRRRVLRCARRGRVSSGRAPAAPPSRSAAIRRCVPA